MPIRFAVASGNWSNAAIWDNGAVPLSGDDVYSNGFTINVNQNITVGRISNAASPPIIANVATPVMTSATTPSGIVTSSPGTNAFTAFDLIYTNGYTSTATNAAFLQYQFPTAKTIVKYMLYTGGLAGRQPATWTFDGSNNGSTWTTLHSITGASLANNSPYQYSFTNTTAYLYYRINVTAVLTSGQQVAIGDLQMSESNILVSGGITGGTFNLQNGFTINATTITPVGTAGTSVITYAENSPAVATINANMQTYAAGNSLSVSGTGTLNISGNIGSDIANGNNEGIVLISSNALLNIVGTIRGGRNWTGGTQVIRITSNPTVNITGDIINSASATDFTMFRITGAPVLNITGTIFGGQSSTTFSTSGTLNITVNGNVQGAGSTGAGISTASAINGTINGNLIAGTTIAAVVLTGSGSLTVTGTLTPSVSSVALSSSSTTASVTLNGNQSSVNGIMPFSCAKFGFATASRTLTLQKSDLTNRIMYTADLLTPGSGLPATTDVRSGVTYGLGGSSTGTCVIPPKNSVTAGVPVDNTVGTALLTLSTLQTYAQAAWNIQTSAITTSGSIGERLKEASTVAITGQQIAGFDI